MTRGIRRHGRVHRLRLPVEDCPASDRDLWQRVASTTLFGEGGARAHLRPATNRAVAKGYAHLACDIAAATLAIEDPLHVRAAAPVLGHATLGTTERHYQQATALQAQRAHADVVARVRKRRRRREK